MLRAVRKVILNKPWNEVVLELLKEGYQLSGIKPDGAVLYPDKQLIARMDRAKEN